MILKRGIFSLLLAFSLLTGIAYAAEPVNINTATKAELQMIKGIGKVTADAIIKYRTENGAFADVKSLTKVKGIGEKKLAKLSGQVIVTRRKIK